MRSNYTSTACAILDRVDFSAQSTHNICGRDEGFILFQASVLNVGPYSPLFNEYQGTLYLCVIQLGIEVCHLPPWHARDYTICTWPVHFCTVWMYFLRLCSCFQHTGLTSLLLYIYSLHKWPNVHYVVSLTIGNIVLKFLWLIIDWMSTGVHDGIVWTEVDYI